MLTIYSKNISFKKNDENMYFGSLGYGVLKDLYNDPLITEELNGSYILEFDYKIDGALSEYLIEENIIKANGQPFVIYDIKKDISKISILAKHWVLNEWTKDFLLDVAPTDLNSQNALNWIQNKGTNQLSISINGDCEKLASARYVRKNLINAIFNEDNALLARFGGELSYDKDSVFVHSKRGNNSGITIRERKNLSGIEFHSDFSTVATRLLPLGKDGLMIDSIFVDSPIIDHYSTPIIKKVEIDSDNLEELYNYCENLYKNDIDKPTVSIKIDFVELSKTTEYQKYSNLESVHLGDTVLAYIPSLELNIKTRVVKTIYNCNLNRITSLELGTCVPNIAVSNVEIQNNVNKIINEQLTFLAKAKLEASDLMKHPFGGYVFFGENEGCIYIADNKDLNQSKNVWKWGLGGLGFSSTGINGTYETAITQDGQIVADFITTGKLNTNVIEGYESLTAQVKSTAESVSNLEITTGKISASVESIESKTEELSVDIDGVKENIIPTSTTSGPNIHIEDASDKKMVNFEIEGKSEQATRSGKNLFNINTATLNSCLKWADGTYSTENLSVASDFIKIEKGKSYISKYKMQIILFNENKEYIGYYNNTTGQYNSFTISTDSECNYVKVSFRSSSNNNVDFTTIGDIQLEEGTTATEYEPYGVMPSPDYPSEIESVGTYNEETGKYEIEVKNTGKNLFDGTGWRTVQSGNGFPQPATGATIVSSDANNISFTSTQWTYAGVESGFIKVKANETYMFSAKFTTPTNRFFITQYDENKTRISTLNSTNVSTLQNTAFTTTNDGYIAIAFTNTTTAQTTYKIENIQLEKGTQATPYEEYKSNTTLIQLDQPLRSLPNGVKDIAYIKNNILYVDRKVGTVVLDGSERWYMDKELTNTVRFYTSEILTNKAKNARPILSNYFITATSVNNINNDDNESAYVLNTTQPAIRINKSIANTLTTFKNWLSNHNTQLDYELAEPYTETIGEVEIPSTFKGVNNITTTDELEPVMNIEYVRDTILSDYVEKQISNVVAIQERKNAEFQITNDEIKSSVSNISTDLDGTKSSLNSVEEKITSQEKTINIISKNIDGTTGDIREVTTTTGFTFNAEGMTIDDGAGYKAQHTAQGTFYKDGDSITGQYTKDGSKQKDLELFGTYSYGKNDINDTPMFVAQLYIDEKGEECFGHFLNI